MSKRIVPRLTEVLEEVKGDLNWLRQDYQVAKAELTALVAVVKASDQVELRRAVWVISGLRKDRKAWLDAIVVWQKARANLEKYSKVKVRQ